MNLTSPHDAIEVEDQGTPLQFSFADMLRYAGPGSPAGVAMALQAMRLAFPLLDPGQPLARRQVVIETAFRGPGARDGFELVTRGLTEDRYIVTADLECPERGPTLEQFVFAFRYRGQACTLRVREGLVTDDFVAMARKDDRTAEDERHFTEMKQALADRLLALPPDEVFLVNER